MILLPHIIVFPFLYLSFTFFPLQFFFSGFFYFLAVLIPNACVCFHFLFSSLIFYSFLHFFFSSWRCYLKLHLTCKWNEHKAVISKRSETPVLSHIAFFLSFLALFSTFVISLSPHCSHPKTVPVQTTVETFSLVFVFPFFPFFSTFYSSLPFPHRSYRNWVPWRCTQHSRETNT